MMIHAEPAREDSRLMSQYLQLALTLLAHISDHYHRPSPVCRGGLTPRQERRAKEMLLASIREDAEIPDVAQAVGLSRAHFIRAFRDCVGETPHRWLTARKIELAKRQMAESDLSLADIALACGFSDQSHFTRVFSRHAGAPPGVWRRERR